MRYYASYDWPFLASKPREVRGNLWFSPHLACSLVTLVCLQGPSSGALDARARYHGVQWRVAPRDGRVDGPRVLLAPDDGRGALGKLLPKKKRTSRFWGVSWVARRGKWLVRYKDTSTPAQDCYVGLFDDEEAAALAYNKAVIAADLSDIREINRVDATGRPLPRD